MTITVNRVLLAHRLFTGISRRHQSCLAQELAQPWQAAVEGRRHEVRGGARKRAAGAGARHQLVFVDRLVATLIHLRHDLPHGVLGLLFGVDRSTITTAVQEMRTLLAERGYAVPNRPDLRLRTLADVFAYAQAEGIELRLNATEIQVRRPLASRSGRRAFVSGKKKQNTMKATVIADWHGRTLWTDALRPGCTHDATAARSEGIADCFQHFPDVEVLLDDGYLGLRRDHPTRPSHPRGSHDPGHCQGESSNGNVIVTGTHPTASPSSTPWPITNAGNNSCAGPIAAIACPRPTEPSPASSPTAQS
ncbi:hypothetical protein J2Z21_009290 [Streptomyces griseochromogenes]|uniref:Transposase n=1 Tax=Streptomyces griseochromogenes TaxID=68214 RepID=A0ABS4M9B2_9ACTN|nr:hypothetical protein [Streptomyces griseochromogenes]